MEYDFYKDPTTGALATKFSHGHETFGLWLEVELLDDTSLLTEVLNKLDDIKISSGQEFKLTGREFSLFIARDEVRVVANANLVANGNLPESLEGDVHNYDHHYEASCGYEDFVKMIHSWATFS